MDAASMVSTSGGSSARRPRVTLGRAAAAGLQQQLQFAQQARHREDVDWIVRQLDQSAQLSLMVRSFIEAGGQASLAAKDEFPRGVRKLGSLPTRDMARALCVMLDIPKERLELLDNYDQSIHNMFFYAHGLPKSFPVSTRDRAEFFTTLRTRYFQAGAHLADLFWDPDGLDIDWTFQLGRFLLVRESTGTVKFVRDVWGKRVLLLPVEIPTTRLYTFSIKQNWNLREAKLVGQLDQGIESSVTLCERGWEAAGLWPPVGPLATAPALAYHFEAALEDDTTRGNVDVSAAPGVEGDALHGDGVAESVELPPE